MIISDLKIHKGRSKVHKSWPSLVYAVPFIQVNIKNIGIDFSLIFSKLRRI